MPTALSMSHSAARNAVPVLVGSASVRPRRQTLETAALLRLLIRQLDVAQVGANQETDPTLKKKREAEVEEAAWAPRSAEGTAPRRRIHSRARFDPAVISALVRSLRDQL